MAGILDTMDTTHWTLLTGQTLGCLTQVVVLAYCRRSCPMSNDKISLENLIHNRYKIVVFDSENAALRMLPGLWPSRVVQHHLIDGFEPYLPPWKTHSRQFLSEKAS